MREYIKKILLAWSHGKQHASSGCGSSYYGTPSMTLRGNVIYSYDTPIAYIANGVMHLNSEKYSSTTSRQQSGLAYWASHQYGLKVVECNESEIKAMI